MTPARAIQKLDRKLAQVGQTITLRRMVANASPVEKGCKAFVRGYKPDELVGGIQQGDSLVILSPTGLAGSPFATDLPRKLDRILAAGRLRTIEMSDPVLLGDQVVRINLLVRG